MLSQTNSNKVEKWTFILCAIVLLFLIYIEIVGVKFFSKYQITFSIITGFFSGILSAISLLYFQEQHRRKQLNDYYLEIEGDYRRIDMGQDNTPLHDLHSMIKDNVGLPLKLSHIKNTHSFQLYAEYWRDDEALIKGFIEFDSINGNSAYGRYTYYQSKTMLGDTGLYNVYRLEDDKTKLFVRYQHLFPRKIEKYPDANRGWEIWEKQN